MIKPAVLTTLLPVRDRRERVVGYSMSSCPAYEQRGPAEVDAVAKASLELVPGFARFAGKNLIVPVTPAMLRDGVVTRFGSSDAVWLVATDALDDPATRRAIDRHLGTGMHFALNGFPEGEPLPPTLMGSTLVLDALRYSPAVLDSRVRLLLDAGLRPLVRNVDDRFARNRVLASGAPMISGRLLVRGASAPVDPDVEDSTIGALQMIARFADGRPPDARFDEFAQDNPYLSASLLRSFGSASSGMRGPRSVTHALNMLGRDAVMERLLAVTARLLADSAGDPELALIALRRARLMELLGAAVVGMPHPRARALAGLLSVAEFALGTPSIQLVERLELSGALADTMGARALPLGQLIDVIDAMDNGWWDDLRVRATKLGVAPLVVSEQWLVAWRTAREELGLAPGAN